MPVDQPNTFWWSYWTPTYTDIRDDKVALFATYLQPGTYEYTFLVQATSRASSGCCPSGRADVLPGCVGAQRRCPVQRDGVGEGRP